jgi:uncharacterized protein (TIGR02145 family)
MNNYIQKLVLSILLASGALTLQAQQGFGTNAPDKSAVVDMTAANKGVLLPRVALTATNSAAPITSPATNLLVVNTATAGTAPNDVTPGFYCWNGTAWLRLYIKNENAGLAWKLTGNTGTTAGTNFVGTTDARDLSFKTNAAVRMRVTAAGNVGIGTAAPTASAALDVNSTTGGLLVPRMNSTQLNAIVNPAEGLMVYNTTLRCLAYYANGDFNCVYTEPSIPAALGSTFTDLYNGWVAGTYTGTATTVTHTVGERFSDNTLCASQLISAGGCGGATTVRGGAGIEYKLVEINGQCWMAENLREIPTAYSNYITTSWKATSPGDKGYWGYYNSAKTDGTAGWAATEPISEYGHVGYLYQWSGAMNGSSAERSRGACPLGFHVPSDCEYMYLEHGLGMKISQQIIDTRAEDTSCPACNVGAKISVVNNLNPSNGFNNNSGFSAILVLSRNYNGLYQQANTVGKLWTSSQLNLIPIYRIVSIRGDNTCCRYTIRGDMAYPVRCLKD